MALPRRACQDEIELTKGSPLRRTIPVGHRTTERSEEPMLLLESYASFERRLISSP